ncbi:MAG: 30S ribosome-binding factor RbfA [Candidatus Nanopelagicales bacterium]|nr:30S ribosome-binding factor RbfA [Candidatus Nanopelagicales bacterium]MCF8538695.1 30S ribosome-binding factor RbfA [Candidatus Nanopelagicales bacterium]MCF8550747.1 30S ribosome-binding factor RbfA [Candidatus Nanopelagicales bacterium]
MGSEARARKLADRIKVIVAQTLEHRVKDPRLGFITITDVRLTPDLRDASIFYTVYGSDQERLDTAAALASSKGMLRTEVGKGTGVKFTPTLEFVLDAIPENAAHVEDLLKAAAADDARVHEQAESAHYAGEANPYKD